MKKKIGKTAIVALMTANNWEKSSAIRAPEMDEVLHKERIEDDAKVTWRGRVTDLPHGTMFRSGQENYAVCNGQVLKWGFCGYSAAEYEQFPENVEGEYMACQQL